MENQIGSGTAKGLIAFLDQLVEKGRATSGSVMPLKTAVRQILSTVDGASWHTTDIRSVDVQDYVDRFSTKTMGKYHADSLRTYRSRLQKAVDWYSKFLSEPGWAPPKGGGGRTSKPTSNTMNKSHKPVPEVEEQRAASTQSTEVAQNSSAQEQTDLIAYPFPLRPGKVVHLYLPLDLSLSEAKRLGMYLESLSVDNS